MKKWFGTDGVRGVANELLTPELALQLAQACAHVLGTAPESRPYVLIGKDTRRSGDMLEAAMAAGFCSMGFDVFLLGVSTTLVVAWLVNHSTAASGVMISASHNPAPDNGIKFFSRSGEKLPDEIEAQIEAVMANPNTLSKPIGAGIGTVQSVNPNEISRYKVAMKETLPTSLTGLKVLVDTANGAAYQLAPALFHELGIDCTVIHNQPNGLNINENCGSTALDSLSQQVVAGGYELGIAFDGDSDRCLAVAPDGQLIDGDQILYLCDRYLPVFQDSTQIIATVMSNLGFEQALQQRGKSLRRTQVGDRYVLEAMKAEGCRLGGEQSGHLIFADYQVTGDGILTALQLMAALRLAAQPLPVLLQAVLRYPQLLVNVRLQAEKNDTLAEQCPDQEVIYSQEQQLGQAGRILVRASGTEPKIRVMVEGREQAQIETIAHAIAATIQQELGV